MDECLFALPRTGLQLRNLSTADLTRRDSRSEDAREPMVRSDPLRAICSLCTGCLDGCRDANVARDDSMFKTTLLSMPISDIRQQHCASMARAVHATLSQRPSDSCRDGDHRLQEIRTSELPSINSLVGDGARQRRTGIHPFPHAPSHK